MTQPVQPGRPADAAGYFGRLLTTLRVVPTGMFVCLAVFYPAPLYVCLAVFSPAPLILGLAIIPIPVKTEYPPAREDAGGFEEVGQGWCSIASVEHCLNPRPSRRAF
jgi:hypothetical protein